MKKLFFTAAMLCSLPLISISQSFPHQGSVLNYELLDRQDFYVNKHHNRFTTLDEGSAGYVGTNVFNLKKGLYTPMVYRLDIQNAPHFTAVPSTGFFLVNGRQNRFGNLLSIDRIHDTWTTSSPFSGSQMGYYAAIFETDLSATNDSMLKIIQVVENGGTTQINWEYELPFAPSNTSNVLLKSNAQSDVFCTFYTYDTAYSIHMLKLDAFGSPVYHKSIQLPTHVAITDLHDLSSDYYGADTLLVVSGVVKEYWKDKPFMIGFSNNFQSFKHFNYLNVNAKIDGQQLAHHAMVYADTCSYLFYQDKYDTTLNLIKRNWMYNTSLHYKFQNLNEFREIKPLKVVSSDGTVSNNKHLMVQLIDKSYHYGFGYVELDQYVNSAQLSAFERVPGDHYERPISIAMSVDDNPVNLTSQELYLGNNFMNSRPYLRVTAADNMNQGEGCFPPENWNLNINVSPFMDSLVWYPQVNQPFGVNTQEYVLVDFKGLNKDCWDTPVSNFKTNVNEMEEDTERFYFYGNTIFLESSSSMIKYSLLDVTGKEILSGKFNASGSVINGLSPGVYFVQYTMNEKLIRHKIILSE